MQHGVKCSILFLCCTIISGYHYQSFCWMLLLFTVGIYIFRTGFAVSLVLTFFLLLLQQQWRNPGHVLEILMMARWSRDRNPRKLKLVSNLSIHVHFFFAFISFGILGFLQGNAKKKTLFYCSSACNYTGSNLIKSQQPTKCKSYTCLMFCGVYNIRDTCIGILSTNFMQIIWWSSFQHHCLFGTYV